MWPNVDAGTDIISKEIRKFRESNKVSKIKFYKNFSPEEFLYIIDHCSCFIGNSSSAIREGSFLGIPCVNIGRRQFQRERGKNIIDVKNTIYSINSGIKSQLKKEDTNQLKPMVMVMLQKKCTQLLRNLDLLK